MERIFGLIFKDYIIFGPDRLGRLPSLPKSSRHKKFNFKLFSIKNWPQVVNLTVTDISWSKMYKHLPITPSRLLKGMRAWQNSKGGKDEYKYLSLPATMPILSCIIIYNYTYVHPSRRRIPPHKLVSFCPPFIVLPLSLLATFPMEYTHVIILCSTHR